MTQIQLVWDKTKKTLKFAWRHFFTLADLSLSINVLVFHTLIWKNALISLGIAITIDWVKQFIKLTPNNNPRRYDSSTTYPNTLNNQWWNPNVMGTPAYLMRNDYNRYN